MTLRVFVSGQSNALGRAAGGPAWSGIDPRVRVWNNVNPLGAKGTSFTDPETARSGGTFDNTDRNNFGVWFCDRLARHADDDVDMTIVARGASSITAWDPEEVTAPMLQECIDVWAATGQAPADVFLWHQGEGDASSMAHAEWETRFYALLDDLTAGGVIDADTKIVIGGIADQMVEAKAYFNREVLQVIAANDPRIGFADARLLTTTDGTHFDGPATYRFGAERYWTGYLTSQDATLYALVNEGGTPGVAGTGTNKVLDIAPVVKSGYRLKRGPIFLTVDQDYEPAADVAAIFVEGIGAGGGGGGASAAGGVARAGLGGAAGGYFNAFIENPEPTYAVGIGAAGIGGPAGQNAGTAGGTTTFGPVMSATGGGGGASSGSTASSVVLGSTLAGIGSGGDINMEGQGSVPGVKLSADQRMGGGGGSTRYGTGAPNRVGTTSASNTFGLPGTGYGSGGGGGISSTTTDQPGGDGAPGVVVVWEYVR